MVNLINHEEKNVKDIYKQSKKDFKTELDEKLSDRNNKSVVIEHTVVNAQPNDQIIEQNEGVSDENNDDEDEAFDIFNENLSSDHSQRDLRKNSSIVVEEDIQKAAEAMDKKSGKKVQINEKPMTPKEIFDEHNIYNLEESQIQSTKTINYGLIEERLMILSIAYHNLAVEMEYLSNHV